MSRPRVVKVLLTHKPDDSGQLYQAVVEIESIFPEYAAEECRKQAVAAFREMVADLMALSPEPVTEEKP